MQTPLLDVKNAYIWILQSPKVWAFIEWGRLSYAQVSMWDLHTCSFTVFKTSFFLQFLLAVHIFHLKRNIFFFTDSALLKFCFQFSLPNFHVFFTALKEIAVIEMFAKKVSFIFLRLITFPKHWNSFYLLLCIYNWKISVFVLASFRQFTNWFLNVFLERQI